MSFSPKTFERHNTPSIIAAPVLCLQHERSRDSQIKHAHNTSPSAQVTIQWKDSAGEDRHMCEDEMPRISFLACKLTSPFAPLLFPSPLLKATHIKNQFQQHKAEANELVAARMRENAKCYATLVSSIQELKALRALDTGDKLKPRDHINATAARVGFSVPRYSDDEEPDFSQPLPESIQVPSRFGRDAHFGQQPKAPAFDSPPAGRA